MSSQQKKIVINHDSFVGLSSRSKTGCLSCRKRKKKCDEVHPICGPCQKKSTDCVWRDFNIKSQKYKFDLKPIIESQNLMRREKTIDNIRISKTSKNNITHFNKQIKDDVNNGKINKLSKTFIGKEIKKENNNIKVTPLKSKLNNISTNQIIPDIINSKETLNTMNSNSSNDINENDEINIGEFLLELSPTKNQNIDQQIDNLSNSQLLDITNSELSSFKHSFNWFGESSQYKSPDIDRAVEELMDNDKAMNYFINNVVEHVKSPAFKPESNYLDLSINSAIKQAHHIINKRRRSNQLDSHSNLNSPSITFDTDQFIDIKEETNNNIENDEKIIDNQKNLSIVEGTSILSISNKEESDDNEEIEEEYDPTDKYLPMDESQMLENVYISDNELIGIFKSKKLHPYLKPTVHLLLSKNNSLKVINPTSPIMRQLDSTGKLFLENYVTNLAMNHLDIGTKQFFLDYAISQAAHDPAILYSLVAWGGMFLVGRNNEVAGVYFDKSLNFIHEKTKTLKSIDLDNDKYIEILLSYVLLLCAEISTGDVGSWYHLLLKCKDILNNYGELRRFANKNKDNKVAKWILSSIFYHDVLSTRITDLGTVISMNEYNDVFKTQKFLQSYDYGLDPFYGLSQDLYILLGEVANSKRSLKNAKFPLSVIPFQKLTLESNKKHYREMEESWFEIFDCRIINCKPPSSMLDIIIKNDPDGKLLEHHLTFFELTQICLRIYIRITFKELEFDNKIVQTLWSRGIRLFNILIGTKLQTLLGLSLLMLGVTAIKNEDRKRLKEMYEKYLINYQILNVRVCWELIGQVWKQYDEQVVNKERKFVDWTEIVNTLGWNCCFT